MPGAVSLALPPTRVLEAMGRGLIRLTPAEARQMARDLTAAAERAEKEEAAA